MKRIEEKFEKCLPGLFTGLNFTQQEIMEIQKARNVWRRATEIFNRNVK